VQQKNIYIRKKDTEKKNKEGKNWRTKRQLRKGKEIYLEKKEYFWGNERERKRMKIW